jgi:hypothetical protein
LPFSNCIAVEWVGVQEAHFIWLGRRNTGKRWATSLVVKLWEVAWDMWSHHNQIKYNLEMAQDLAQCDLIKSAVRSEYAFGRSGLPRRDWHLFKRPFLSLLETPCITLMPGFFALRQHALDRTEELLMTLTPP